VLIVTLAAINMLVFVHINLKEVAKVSVLASMIVKASKKQLNYQTVCDIFAVVTDIEPVDGTPVASLRRGLKNCLDQMSSREVGIKYDALKNKGLI